MNEQLLREIIYSLSRKDYLLIICSFLLFLLFNYYITRWIWGNNFPSCQNKSSTRNHEIEIKTNSEVNQKLNKNLRKKIRIEELAKKQIINAKQARKQRREAYEAEQKLKEMKHELYENKINIKVLERLSERKKALIREQKEYEKWKLEIDINDTGDEFEFEDENLNSEYTNLSNFINTITKEKVKNINDLSVEFKISIEGVISRINQLEEQRIIDGVLTDKGQYIFISEKEWENINFRINKDGKVSKSKDLVLICNNVICM
ncbi:putative coiled coil [Cryptosporidium sp. chipmunk genotype I]|uniref:putative coiled coil n=1 Tax=Cryptosporidium sp. chipmunk genotype I TaxID=1280935 RepID=UPI00351A4F09|nr:putative coiled coil [Cryptosporidium sp. chipmunk genotype I]